MKKHLKIIIPILLIIIVGIVVLVIINDKENKIEINKDFVYISSYNNKIPIDNDNYVITNYNDYKNIFNSNELTEKDFENNNYAIVEIIYDPCSKDNITPVEYKIEDEEININVKYTASCGGCALSYKYYLLPISKNIIKTKVNINDEAINKVKCDTNVSWKPLIYLYPKKETNVTVKLGNPHLLTTAYPKYDNEWKVLAKPNGYLIDSKGRTYYGLYWEAKNNIRNKFKDGYLVNKKDIIPFLEEKLEYLGLNERERNEFIIYWLPKLEENEYNLIRFEDINIINEQMPLEITPKPDTIIRIFMEYKPIQNKIEIKEQNLSSINRKGFTVVEWGGSLIK